MSEPRRCYGSAAPTLHPTPQVQEGLRGVGGAHIRSSSSASHISPRAGGGVGGPGMGDDGNSFCFPLCPKTEAQIWENEADVAEDTHYTSAAGHFECVL